MANPTLGFASANSGFIPEATGMVVAYMRKQDKFKSNRYVQYIPTDKVVGLYAQLGRDEPIRIVSDAEYAYEDGDEAPQGLYHQVPFQMQEFRCFRRAYPWRLGYMAIDQATLWKPKVIHMQSAITKCMTNRTNRIITKIQTVGNWGTHTAAANTLNSGAGNWLTASDDPNSPNYNAILKSMQAAAQAVNLDTNGVVEFKDLCVLVAPELALKITQTAELLNYCRESKDALQLVEKGFDPQYDLWGLPSTYKGFKFLVEDAPIVTGRPATANLTATAPLQPPEESTARAYCMSPTSAAMLARPGSIDGEAGAMSFSTVQIYHHGGLAQVKVFDDPENERVKGRVQENIAIEIGANMSGYLITSTM